MASERLNVPEEHLLEVICVIRNGLDHTNTSSEVRTQMEKWCRDMERYMLGKSKIRKK